MAGPTAAGHVPMARPSPPPHAPGDGALPPTRSSPPPSDPSLDRTHGGDENEDADEEPMAGSAEVWKQRLPYGDQNRAEIDHARVEQLVGIKMEKERSGAAHGDSPNSKKRQHKDGAAHREQPSQVINDDIKVSKDLTRRSRNKGTIPSPRVTTSPGVNMLMRTAAQKRGSKMMMSRTTTPGASLHLC